MISRAPRMRRELLPDRAAGDPLRAFDLAPGEPAFYWRSDAHDIEIAALGAVAVVDTEGPSRFRDAAARLRELHEATDDAGGDAPFAVGGFAFDGTRPAPPWSGFPALRFFVPRMLWIRRAGETRMLVTYAAGREQTPLAMLDAIRRPPEARDAVRCDAGDWHRRVLAAIDAIRAGDIEKIVLARRQTVAWAPPACAATTATSITSIVRELAESRPSCFTFLVRWSGRTFIGSSPERLLRLAGGALDADALAGTTRRGLNPAHDAELARDLVASVKERHEHRIVADAIRDALGPVACEIDVPDEPRVASVPEAHHLHTPIRAMLADDARRGALEIAERLHPTPAVCGAPRADACRRLAIEEPDRGWYGGGIGWLAPGGDGEFAVALRAALIDRDAAHVWAGAGIVEGSSPEHEFDETERKLASILPYFEGGRSECA